MSYEQEAHGFVVHTLPISSQYASCKKRNWGFLIHQFPKTLVHQSFPSARQLHVMVHGAERGLMASHRHHAQQRIKTRCRDRPRSHGRPNGSRRHAGGNGSHEAHLLLRSSRCVNRDEFGHGLGTNRLDETGVVPIVNSSSPIMWLN